jgi:anti-sigma B factor antagonist
MEFSIHRERRGTIPVLRVRGELDLLNAPQLLDGVHEAVGSGAGSIAFDLSELNFIDSFGLSVLVTAKKQTAERGGRVYLVGVTEQLRRALNLVQVGNQFCLCSEAELPGS